MTEYAANPMMQGAYLKIVLNYLKYFKHSLIYLKSTQYFKIPHT